MRIGQLIVAVALAGCASRVNPTPETDTTVAVIPASADATATALAVPTPSSDCPPAPTTEWERRRIVEGPAVRNASPDDKPSVPPPYRPEPPAAEAGTAASSSPCR